MNKNLKFILINVGIMLALTFSGLFFIFYIYLPTYTKHDETITVPDFEGLNKAELENFVEKFNLKYEITDSSYDADAKLNTVLSQHPKPGTMVKEKRKIYLHINSAAIPLLKMPDLTGLPIKNAQIKLGAVGLLIDSIQYKQSNYDGMVLDQIYRGFKIEKDAKIKKGEKVILVVGKKDMATEDVEMPEVVGLPIELAMKLLEEKGFDITIVYDDTKTEDPKNVVRQKPESGTTIKQGSFVDIWVDGKAPEENIELDADAEE